MFALKILFLNFQGWLLFNYQCSCLLSLCDSLFSISYSVPFVKGFLNFFQVSFRHFRPLKVTISCFFLRTPCLPCLSGTGSLAELYYITTFFSFCQPLFYLFFPFFPLFCPFFSTFRAFYPFFLGFCGFFVGRDGCGAMIRSMQNLGTSCTGNGFILFACTKRTKSTPEVCGPLDSGNGSNRRSIRCFG